MVVVGLSAMLMALGASSLRDGRSHASATGLATVVAEELVRCRRRRWYIVAQWRSWFLIRRCQRLFRGLFRLRGRGFAHCHQTPNLFSRFSRLKTGGCQLGQFRLLAPNGSSCRQQMGAFNPNDWLPSGYNKDYAYIFMPDGTVRSNDLPTLDNAYPLVVSSGLTIGSASAPAGTAVMGTAPAYFGITAASDVQTILVNSAGFVSRVGGLPGSSGLTGQVVGFNQNQGVPATITTVASSAPQLLGEPVITPIQDPNLMPPNTDAVLSKESFLSFETKAVSLTGDQLYCS
jgi:hypothetical protein